MVSLSNFGLKSAGIFVIDPILISCKGCSAAVGVISDFLSLFGDSDEVFGGCSTGVEVTGDGMALAGTEHSLLGFVCSDGDRGTVASSMSCSVVTQDEIDVVDDP
jgi:hypothetical protein